ncbi:zinc-binding dehydrogenase [Aurantimonas aggregata]|uniref:zinc-binding dehydrogenase n=1 Tax=Aurantimonas aggregata TaxID=2047720 RepID=UPI0019455D7F|nr:zinc-binding dehydrogenase [Aurantimonas aggregata]
MPELWSVKAPASLEPCQAATLPVAGLTAWSALLESAGVAPGTPFSSPAPAASRCLVFRSPKRAVPRSSSAANPVTGRGCALGADHFVDTDAEDWMEAVYRITGDRGADIVLEVIGGAHLGKSVELAAVGGHVCQIDALDGFEFSSPAMPLMLKNITIHGIGTGSRRALERLVRALDRAGIRPVVDARYPLVELPAAFKHLARRSGRSALGPCWSVAVAT